jgi:formylglycine-generating enzyme required for sulfatase activity
MKKLIGIVFVFILVFAGCDLGSGGDSDQNSDNDQNSEVISSGEEFTLGDKDRKTISGIAFTMIYIHPGSFQRDTDPLNISVITKGYWVGETEVTQELFSAVMGINPSYFEGQPKLPVDSVNWYDAITFCNKLSILDGKDPVYSVEGITDWANLQYEDSPSEDSTAAQDAPWIAVTEHFDRNGYRLPTQTEWTWAAMGANKTTQPNVTDYSKKFAGSTGINSISDYAWHGPLGVKGNSDSKTHEVKTKLPNELGIYDMNGNVQEWCWDRGPNFYELPEGTLTDYRGRSIEESGTDHGRGRLLKGRNYWDDPLDGFIWGDSWITAYGDDGGWAYMRQGTYGFRIFRTN